MINECIRYLSINEKKQCILYDELNLINYFLHLFIEDKY